MNSDNISADISLLSSDERKLRLKRIMGLLDLTTLEGIDNTERVKALCSKALAFNSGEMNAPAAVCVYPVFVETCRKELGDSGIHVASVAGGFPSGQMPLPLRIEEVRYAVAGGADEIDMVISRGRFLEGDTDFILREVSEIKTACGPAHLKVILETGELVSEDKIKLASQLAIKGGADFIKTSTGKVQPAATLQAMQWMLEVIRDHNNTTGIKIGIKPAGGISTPDQALQYYQLVEQNLGEEWLNSRLFRIGASRLADAIMQELQLT